MPETATQKGTEEKKGDFTWGRDSQGNLLIDGVVVERYRGGRLPEPTDNEPEEQEEPKEEAKPVKTEEVKEPPPVAQEPPPEPQKPEKHKFKLKVQGEELEQELTQEQLVARLQMAEDYQRKTMALAEERRKIEPFLPIIEKPEFKQWLSDQVEAGAIEAPKTAPRPSDEDIIKYRIREQEPEFREIQHLMAEWAVTLPSYEADILATNHKVFNDTYDRFKATYQAKKLEAQPIPPPKEPAPVRIDPKDLERIIQSKEVSKAQAHVESPGGTPPEVDPKKEWRKMDRELRRAVREKERNVRYDGKMMDSEVAWVLHRMREPR